MSSFNNSSNMMIELNKLINLSIESQTSYDIASILYLMYHNDYKYSVCGNLWYYFENHIWYKSKNSNMLKTIILTELYDLYLQRISDNNKKRKDLTNKEQENIEIQNIKIANIIKILESDTFREEIIMECKKLFYDIEFLNKIDENPYLIGFNNGVYDLKSGELREGRRDDYISLCTNINKIDFNKEDPQWNELNKFICTIFPNEEKRNYFLTYLSTCLQGINNEQKFRIWVGERMNGKSKLEELFIEAFGTYTFKFPITLLTGKCHTSNKIIAAKGARFGYFVEPSDCDTINSGLFKEFCGNDKIYSPCENHDYIEFIPQYKMSLICNSVPNFSKNDERLLKGLEIIEFTSKFKENPNPENPNEFMIDTKISEKIKSWKELFMAYLIDIYYTQYRESNGNSLVVPEEVKTYSEKVKLSKGF